MTIVKNDIKIKGKCVATLKMEQVSINTNVINTLESAGYLCVDVDGKFAVIELTDNDGNIISSK